MKLTEVIKKVHVKAIAIGLLIQFGLGVVVGPLASIFLLGPHLRGLALHVWSLALGSVATIFAAYVTARKSESAASFNVFILWAINEIIGLVSLIFWTYPAWYNLAGSIVLASASFLGWYVEQNSRSAAEKA